MWRLLRVAFLTVLLGPPRMSAQDAVALRAWNRTLADVMRATRDPIGELTPDVLARGETAANALLAAEKPGELSADEWRAMQATAYKVLGWAGVMDMHGGHPTAAFVHSLQLDPGDATVALQLMALLLQENPPRTAESLFYQARAAFYTGPGSLPSKDRDKLAISLKESFEQYHGADPPALEALQALAISQAVPPADFVLVPRRERSAPAHIASALLGDWTGRMIATDGSAQPTYLVVEPPGGKEVSVIGPDRDHLASIAHLIINGSALQFQVTQPGRETLFYTLMYLDGAKLQGQVQSTAGRIFGHLEYERVKLPVKIQ